MTELPIDAFLPNILEAVREKRSLVLVAEPGAGKTTRVPPAVVRDSLSAEFPGLVLLQPRRVAARAVAARIAEEQGWGMGEEVGYQVRFDRKIGPRTRLQVVTEGILTRRLIADPFLEGIGAVVLDEFHERSIHTDLALALLREARDSVREDLILIVMSATLDAEPVARYLGDAPIVRVPGRTYPIELRYRDPGTDPPSSRVAAAVAELAAERPIGRDSDILVFLPGMEEIRRSARALEGIAAEHDLAVLPLHGSLSAEAQDLALQRNPRRKVILSTNIAETSLTIDGVSAVVDLGTARVAEHDPVKGLDRLELRRISRASATQRAGRAGRTGPGVCIRLWPERETRGMPEHDRPEVHRVDLASSVLALRAWGHRDAAAFPWFEPPSSERLAASELLLIRLGAIDDGGAITELGRRLLALPAHPRIGRLLIAANEVGRPEAGATLAALLAEKEILTPDAPRGDHAESDLLIRLDLFARVERDRFASHWRDRGVDIGAARQVAQTRDDFLRMTRARNRVEPIEGDDVLCRCLLAAYPDRVVRQRGEEGTGVMVGGRGIRLDRRSAAFRSELFLAHDPREDRQKGTLEAKVRVATAIRREWLGEVFPEFTRREKGVAFDQDRGSVVGVTRLCFLDLVLQEDRNASVPPDVAAEVLAEHALPRRLELIDDTARGWLTRLELLKSAMPERDWPSFDDNDWREILREAARGRRSESDLKGAPWLMLLKNRVDYRRLKEIDDLAPESIEVPSGNRIRLRYEEGRPPVLEVRLQEMFGLPETPRVAGGRLAVLLHLLGPNFRPVQVTSDLASFWANTYIQVRKDLRNRYPKHSWPEDPLAARPEAKGGRRPG